MIPTFSGKINRREYWSGLVFWVCADLVLTLAIIGIVNVLQPDKNTTDGIISTVGALLFIMGFLYTNLRVVSLVFKRGRDLGKYGMLYAFLALIFTPMIIIIGVLPSAESDQDQP
ncbi:DUF805 domain-containing protein [Aeromicrobium sp.]|nr:DUF805 domain-containing protein [Candidatus Saccharibacteria bacterium]